MPPLLALTWDDAGDRTGQWFEDHGPAVISAIVLATLGAIIVQHAVRIALRPAIARQMGDRPGVEVDRRVETLAGVVVRTTQVVFFLLALFTILPEVGLDIRPVLAGVGITGIALGFGAQSLVRDGLNGIFILGEDQYAVGDIVTVAGHTGTVEDVTLRRTLLRDADGVVYSIPNSAVVVAANLTRGSTRVRVSLPVAPASDFAKVREVADAVGRELAADPNYAGKIVSAPAFLRVDNIDAAGVSVQINGIVVPGTQWEVAGALRARLLEAFQREGIRVMAGS